MFYELEKRWYLNALICHQEIFSRGCKEIWHFQCEAYYNALVNGSAEVFLIL